MKRVFAIVVLVLMLGGPLFAGGVAEAVGDTFLTFAGSGAGAGAVAGALAGAAGGPVGIAAGAVFGLVAGAIGGGIIGANVQNAQDEKTQTENTGNIGTLELTNESVASENEQLEGDIKIDQANLEPQKVALAKWQDTYDSSVALQQDSAEQGLKTLKENWGLYNATLASQNRQGATAKLLSKEQKDRIVTYAGDDMELNTDSIVAGIKDVYSDEANFDEEGNLTQAGANKLALDGSSYGIYDKQMSDLAVNLIEQKKTTETNIQQLENSIDAKRTTIGLNEEAILLNQQTIENLKKNNTKLAGRRWGSSD